MRQVLLIAFILLIPLFIKAQTVENIRTEQDGERVNIYYQIINSIDKQFFDIEISCLVNNSKKITPQSITGDVGYKIKGGKVEYKAVWDVLKDVDELTSAEFFVKIELMEDYSKEVKNETNGGFKNFFKYKGEKKGHFYIAYPLPALVKIGYMGNWGAAFSFGPDWEFNDVFFLLSISKSIKKTNDFQFNISTQIGINSWYEYNYDYSYEDDYGTEFCFGLGTELAYKHLYLSFELDFSEHTIFFPIGIGWRF